MVKVDLIKEMQTPEKTVFDFDRVSQDVSKFNE